MISAVGPRATLDRACGPRRKRPPASARRPRLGRPASRRAGGAGSEWRATGRWGRRRALASLAGDFVRPRGHFCRNSPQSANGLKAKSDSFQWRKVMYLNGESCVIPLAKCVILEGRRVSPLRRWTRPPHGRARSLRCTGAEASPSAGRCARTGRGHRGAGREDGAFPRVAGHTGCNSSRALASAQSTTMGPALTDLPSRGAS